MTVSMEALLEACAAGDAAALRSHLTSSSFDINEQQIQSLYSAAIAHDSDTALSQLLDTFSTTPPEEDDLRAALRSGSRELLRTLLKHDPSLANTHFDRRGSALLVTLSSRREPSYLALLLDAGANPNPTDTDGLPGPMEMAAAFYETPEVLKLLVSHGASIQKSGAVSAAANAGMVANVQYLLDQGAPASGETKTGNPPLHAAIRKGHFEVVKLLIERGASFDETDALGQTARHTAETAGISTNVKELFEGMAGPKGNN
ncbi:hypothetical protein MMC11_001815 [Xylographa trunciseda]|nr:hypothetical protein [Xylographa trunciseda]